MPTANHSISLPIANALLSVYNLWSLIYADAIAYLPSSIRFSSSLAVTLVAKVFVQLSAIAFVLSNEVINCLRTNALLILCP